jgi:hypothetical protein
MSDRYDVYGGIATRNYGSSDDCIPWTPFAERLADEQTVAQMDAEEQRWSEHDSRTD